MSNFEENAAKIAEMTDDEFRQFVKDSLDKIGERAAAARDILNNIVNAKQELQLFLQMRHVAELEKVVDAALKEGD